MQRNVSSTFPHLPSRNPPSSPCSLVGSPADLWMASWLQESLTLTFLRGDELSFRRPVLLRGKVHARVTPVRNLLPPKDGSLILKTVSSNTLEEIRHLIRNLSRGFNCFIRTQRGSSDSRSQVRSQVWLAGWKGVGSGCPARSSSTGPGLSLGHFRLTGEAHWQTVWVSTDVQAWFPALV